MAINYLGALDAAANMSIGYAPGMRDRYGNAISAYHAPRQSPLDAAAMERANRVASIVRPDIAGTPARDAALLPAGFPIFSFALANGTNAITQTMNIQTPFRGQRLTALVIRNGTSATTTAPLMQFFLVGQKPIITAANPVPLEVFNQNSFDTNLLLPPTMPGVIYQLSLSLTAALTTTDTVTCIVGLLGSAVL
jgi:hypothetical protein